MSPSSRRRAQTSPVAALTALVVVCAAISCYATVLDDSLPTADRDLAPAALSNVESTLADDSGVVVVGLLLTDRPGDVWFLPEAPPSGYRENGHIEPERMANDVTPDEGELQDELEIEVWYDDGLLGFGGCDGTQNAGESTVSDGRGDVAGALREGYERFALDSDTNGIRLFDCLETGESRCIGVRWRLPEETGNHVQTDGVDFSLRFAATECLAEPTSPFGDSGAQ